LFDRPAYQDGIVPASAPEGRAVPDVAMDADATTGFLTGVTQTFPDGSVRYGELRFGGTSLASPLFAGMTALALQQGGARSVGELNPVIYADHARAFTDVSAAPPVPGVVRADYANGVDPSAGTLYSVRTFDQDTSLSVDRGWDDVTGVGVPNAGWLRNLSRKY
jgi:subtilase family serine protease